MRICHSLLGEAADVDDQELQWRKPLELVRQAARERWQVDADDLIILADGGLVVGPGVSAEDLGHCHNVFFFLRSALDPQAGSTDTLTAAVCGLAPVEEEALGEEETAALDALTSCGLGAGDPALEALQGNVTEARRRLLEARPVIVLAARVEERLEVQRLAAQSVLDNLASHRATCTRSMGLFLTKHERAQERIDQHLGQVEASLAALRAVPLHPALQVVGRETLADVLPRDKIVRFTAGVQAERARLVQCVGKLKQEDSAAQAWCDQVASKVQQFLQDDSVTACISEVRRTHARALEEMVPALKVRVPRQSAVADAALVLEEEKRTAALLEELGRLCGDIRAEAVELQLRWERQRANFLQRLREVSYTQSQVRAVERRAALLEESINAQHSQARQLAHLHKMPNAYHKALAEVDRRRRFRARYIAQAEQARATLARMAEDENARRRAFFLRHGCHLPADLALGLSALVPLAMLEVADFDAELLDLGGPEPGASSSSASARAATTAGAAASASMRHSGSSGSPAASTALAGGDAAREDLEIRGRELELEAVGSGAGAGADGAELRPQRLEELEAQVRRLKEELAAAGLAAGHGVGKPASSASGAPVAASTCADPDAERQDGGGDGDYDGAP